MSKKTEVYLADNKKELSKPELKAIRQQVREAMDPECLKHLWFYLDVIQPGEANESATHLHTELKAVITQSVKGVCYKEDLTDGVTYHAELIYNDNGEEIGKGNCNSFSFSRFTSPLITVTSAARFFVVIER